MEKIIVFIKKKEIKPSKVTEDQLFKIIKNKEVISKNITTIDEI